MSTQEAVKDRTDVKIKKPRRFKVCMYNDDFTPMDFVVSILEQIFDKSPVEAEQLMMNIHKSSYAVVGIYSKDIAQTKATMAEKWSRSEGFPLKVKAVEE